MTKKKTKVALLDEDNYTFIQKLRWPPKDVKSQNLLANELLDYGINPKHDDIKQFAIDRGYNPYYLFHNLAEKNPYFAECLETAKAAIGIRRERAARERKQDATSVFNVQSYYDRTYRDLLKEKREWVSLSIAEKQANQQKSIIFNVVAQEIPPSPLVPVRVVEKLETKDNE